MAFLMSLFLQPKSPVALSCAKARLETNCTSDTELVQLICCFFWIKVINQSRFSVNSDLKTIVFIAC